LHDHAAAVVARSLSQVLTRAEHPLDRAERRPTATRARQFADLADLHPRLLRCFVAVAEELHFSRAADRLFLPQPWLSRTIRQLERQVGAPLFIRSTRCVRLTSAGQRLLPAARDVLEALDAVGQLANARRAELRVPHVPGHDTAMLVLDRLAGAHPELAVQELAVGDREQLAAVADGRLDVAVCRLSDGPPSDVCCELLRLDPALVAFRRRRADLPDAIDLRRIPVAVAAGAGGDDVEDRLALELERAIGRPLPRVRVAIGSGTELGAFERSGEHAFMTFESTLFPDERYARLGTVPVQPVLAWWLVWRPENTSPARQAFVDAARSVAAERLWKATDAFDGKPLMIGAAAWTQTA
jgi:DNA-binding transcriptional LysR family regulator